MRIGAVACASLLFCCGGAARDSRDSPITVSIPAPVGAARPVVRAPTSAHGRVLDRLTGAPTHVRFRNGIAIPLPDEQEWRDVEFWLVPSVVSVQYGEASDFHAILGAFVVSVPNSDEPGACDRAFVAFARVWLDAFDADYDRERNWTDWWTRSVRVTEDTEVSEHVAIRGGYILGKVSTLIVRGTYSSAYAVYPAWKTTCLAVGVAMPNRDDAAPQARALRDRFVSEILPGVRVTVDTPPAEERH